MIGGQVEDVGGETSESFREAKHVSVARLAHPRGGEDPVGAHDAIS